MSGYSVIELNKIVIEMNKFCSLSVKHNLLPYSLLLTRISYIPTGTEILSPGILSYLYWDFVPWDFVLFILGFCPLGFCPPGFCPLGFCPYPSGAALTFHHAPGDMFGI